jgi:hypothetical protein
MNGRLRKVKQPRCIKKMILNLRAMSRQLLIYCLFVISAFVAGCAQAPPLVPPPDSESFEQQATENGAENPSWQEGDARGMEQQWLSPTDKSDEERRSGIPDRAFCFKLQPSVPLMVTKTKKGTKKATVVKTTSRCQPQSLIYARCRSGINTCRLGDTSPVQWYSCAKKMGNTTNVPTSGAIMVLDSNSRRKMTTGHPLYVENAEKNRDGTWLLRISHTNYDRQCNLDQDAEVIFDPVKVTASFLSGPWSCWARDLKTLGFITR